MIKLRKYISIALILCIICSLQNFNFIYAMDANGDLSKIYGSEYIIQTLEEDETRENAYIEFGEWEPNSMVVGREDDAVQGKVRTAVNSAGTLNYKRYAITDNAWKNLSSYNWLNVRYKGDGKSNVFKMVFRNASNEVLGQISLTTNASDQEWKFYSINIEDWSRSEVAYINISLANPGKFNFDDLAFSVSEPYKADVEPSTSPSASPSTSPSASPSTSPSASPDATPETSSLEKIYGDRFVIQTNEDNETRKGAYTDFGEWEPNTMVIGREDDAVQGKVRIAVNSAGTLNYKRYAITDNAWKNLSSYNWLSIRYKGDGNANVFKMVFRNAANEVLGQISLTTNASDQEWKFYSINIEDWSRNDVAYINISLENEGKIIFDDLAFSASEPYKADIKPSTSPSTSPSASPSAPPSTSPSASPEATPEASSLEKIYGDKFIIQTNENNENREGAYTDFGNWEDNTLVIQRADDKEHGMVRSIQYSLIMTNYKRYVINNSEWKDISAYKYFSLWYKGDGKSNTLKIVFRDSSNKTLGEAELKCESGNADWQFYKMDISGWSKTNVAYMNISVANAGTICFDDIAFSEQNPTINATVATPTPMPTKEPEATPTPLEDGELAYNGDIENSTSLSNTYYQYRTPDSPVSSAKNFFTWEKGGENSAPEVRSESNGSYMLKVMRRNGTLMTNNNQSVYYKYNNKGVPVKPGRMYRIVNYIYVEGTGTTSVNHVIKYTDSVPAANEEVITLDKNVIKRGEWQCVQSDYYVPVSDEDDFSKTYYMSFAPYVADCDQAGTYNTVFYLDDFSVKEITPQFSISGNAVLTEGENVFTVNNILNQWGELYTNDSETVKFEIIQTESIVPSGVTMSDEGVLTIPEDTMSFECTIRGALLNASYIDQKLWDMSFGNDRVTGFADLKVKYNGTQNESNMVSEVTALEQDGGVDEVPVAYEGNSVFMSENNMIMLNSETDFSQGAVYRVSAFVYLPGSGSGDINISLLNSDDKTELMLVKSNITKGKWQKIEKNILIPLSEDDVEKYGRYIIEISCGNDFYIDCPSVYRVNPEIVMPNYFGVMPGTYDYGVDVIDQWGYTINDLKVIYSIELLTNDAEEITFSTEGELVIPENIGLAEFNIYAGITARKNVDFSKDTVNVVAVEKRNLVIADAEQILSKLRAASSGSEVQSIIEKDVINGYNAYRILCLDYDAYLQLSSRGKKQVCEEMFNVKTQLTGKDICAEKFSQFIQIQKVIDELCAATEQEFDNVINKYVDIIGFSPNENSYYTLYKDNCIKALVKDFDELNTIEQVNKTFDETCTYTAFNSIKANDKDAMHKFLTDKRSELGVMSQYFTEADKQNLCLSALCAATVTSYDELSPTINKIINDVINNSGSGSSGGGGGAGSGGGGGSSSGGNRGNTVTGVVVTNPSTVQTEDSQSFVDITDDVSWAKESIEYLREKGIVSGVGDNRFEPNRNITREEFVKMVVEALEISTQEASCEYSDVSSDAWYYPYISAATSIGLVNGQNDGQFGIGQTITRQDMAVIILRCMQYKETDLKSDNAIIFDDSDEIASYASEAVEILSANGIMNGVGDNMFEPKGNATRAMACKVIYMLIK